MVRIRFSKVISFSSEDPAHPAENLVKDSTKLKWQCQTAGETKSFATLQFEKPSVVRSIDIANNSAAFVEVLVGRPGMPESDYKVLLPSSSLMTPTDSRNNVNCNRVRMFGTEKLDQNVCKEKWDIVKIICTQPFNSHIKYGITFVAMHEQDGEKLQMPSVGIQKLQMPSIGIFKMKDETEAAPPRMNIGSLFQRLKASNSDSTSPKAAKVTLAEAMLKETERDLNKLKKNPGLSPSKVKVSEPPRKFVVIPPVSRNGEKRKMDTDDYLPKRNRFSWDADTQPDEQQLDVVNQPDLSSSKNSKTAASSKSSSSPSTKIRPGASVQTPNNVSSNAAKFQKSVRVPQTSPTTPKVKSSPSLSLVQSGARQNPNATPLPRSLDIQNSGSKPSSTSDAHQNTKPVAIGQPTKNRVRKPFKELMKGVVFAMSGYVNPKRGQLRDMAVEMGAKYRPDWDNTCTHLICAFVNTPKFNEVVGKGKIVKEHWIDECYKKRKRLPWRRFCLDRRDKGEESEDEVWSEDVKDAGLEASDNDVSVVSSPSEDKKKSANKRPRSVGQPSSRNDDIVIIDDEKEDMEKSDDDSEYKISSGSDSDDLFGVKTDLRSSKPKATVFIDLSDEESDQNRNSKSTDSNSKFFSSFSFFLDLGLSVKEKIECARAISVNGGTVCKKLDSATEYYIAWATDMDRLRTIKFDFPSLKLVAPLWIEDCKIAKCAVPYSHFELSV